MPTNRKVDDKNSSASSVSDPPDPIFLSQLPEDIVVYILKRLPVKSIGRFKCVAKGWLFLLSTPKFISMHSEQTSNDPLNHSFIIRSIGKHQFQRYHDHNLYLLNINSNNREPISLHNPFQLSHKMELVGSINGLVCLCFPNDSVIRLWNPAMKIYKVIRLCTPVKHTSITSLSFAYDSVNDDYKIMRIDFLKLKRSRKGVCIMSHAEVYSASLDSWRRVHIDFRFVVVVTGSILRSIVIGGGISCTLGCLYQPNNQCKLTKKLMYYDMRNGSFKHVSPPELARLDGTTARFVDWKGNLGMIVSSPSAERGYFVDILVYDEKWMCWNKISSHGPIGLKIERRIQCTNGGVILAEAKKGKLMLYDPITNGIKEFSIPGAFQHSFQAYGYIESLVALNGMEKVEESFDEINNFTFLDTWDYTF